MMAFYTTFLEVGTFKAFEKKKNNSVIKAIAFH